MDTMENNITKDVFEEMNKAYSFFLLKITEPINNQLVITLKESTTSGAEESIAIGNGVIDGLRNLSPNGPGKIYQILFNTYAAYNVSNESFSTGDGDDIGTGRLVKIFKKSLYMDFIRTVTTVEFVMESKLKHYQIICENHIIDIATLESPIFKK